MTEQEWLDWQAELDARQARMQPFMEEIRALLLAAGFMEIDREKEQPGFEFTAITPTYEPFEASHLSLHYVDHDGIDREPTTREYYKALMDRGYGLSWIHHEFKNGDKHVSIDVYPLGHIITPFKGTWLEEPITSRQICDAINARLAAEAQEAAQ